MPQVIPHFYSEFYIEMYDIFYFICLFYTYVLADFSVLSLLCIILKMRIVFVYTTWILFGRPPKCGPQPLFGCVVHHFNNKRFFIPFFNLESSLLKQIGGSANNSYESGPNQEAKCTVLICIQNKNAFFTPVLRLRDVYPGSNNNKIEGGK